MTDPKPLEPLLLDDAIGDDLRAMLEARSAHEPSRSDLARLGDRLAAALPPGTLPPSAAPGAPPTAPPTGTGTLLSSGAAKVALATAVLAGALGGGLWLSRSDDPAPPPRPAATSSSPALPPASIAPIEEPPPAVASASPSSSPRPSSAAPRASTTSNVAAPPEATLLARAHDELLKGAPASALATVTEHERAYPHGALSQEREVIAIEALVALGRGDEARRRADAFHRVHPGSSHGDRIERLVGPR